jgi:hypothetical protein
MGIKTTSDDIIRRLALEFRVVTLGGVAVIATGLSRNTYTADIWVEPLASAGEWSDRIAPLIYDYGTAEPVAMGSWTRIARAQLAEVIDRDRVIRISGLERPLAIFRNQIRSMWRISTTSGSALSQWMTAPGCPIRWICWSASRRQARKSCGYRLGHGSAQFWGNFGLGPPTHLGQRACP